jgi:adenine-specific DNA-methyltransferase
VGEAVKAPDYAFRIGEARKFFVEAKKPSVNLKDYISPAYQCAATPGRPACL